METITKTNKGTALLNPFSTEFDKFYVATGIKENSIFYKEGKKLTVVASFIMKEDAILWANTESLYHPYTKYIVFDFLGDEIII